MPALPELQASFAAAILTGAPGRLPLSIAPSALGAERRIQIYRNHLAVSLGECLAATFPVLKELVGEGFFTQTARRFASEFPPSSPVLSEYGEAFPAYLAQTAGAEDFAYLADVGAFEWAINRAYHADNAAPLRAEALLSVPEANRGSIALALHPSARLVVSEYPILDIWRAHQPGARDERVDLDRGGVRVIVWRQGLDVGWRTLTAAEARFVEALMSRSSLADACAAALAEDSGFQPASLLAEMFAADTFTGFSPDTLH